MFVPLENLSRRQRSLTPYPFCVFLTGMMRGMFPNEEIAILWVAKGSHWFQLWPTVKHFRTIATDATTYAGPWPVVCHPPCGPWGKYSHNCHQSREDGIKAMELVHVYGGIVEQPVGSQLFKEHGNGGVTIKVNQGNFGHKSMKPTLLYLWPHRLASSQER